MCSVTVTVCSLQCDLEIITGKLIDKSYAAEQHFSRGSLSVFKENQNKICYLMNVKF